MQPIGYPTPHVISHFAPACPADLCCYRVPGRLRLAAASAEGDPAQSPPLKSGISLVSLDFLVIGRDGQPVPDLKAEEVSLKLGGRARPLTAINLVDVAGSAQPAAVSPLPPPFGTNVQTRESRAFVLVVDNDSFRVGTERPLREAADTFLDKLAPTNRIALVTMPYGGTRVSLTTEQEAVRASLASWSARPQPTRPRTTWPAVRAARSTRCAASSKASSEPGSGDRGVLFRQHGRPERAGHPLGASVATCALLPENFREVGAAAADAGRPALHHRAGRPPQSGGRPRNLAGVTGGVRLALGGVEDNAFTRCSARPRRSTAWPSNRSPRSATAASSASSSRCRGPDVTVRVRPTLRIDRADGKGTPSPKELLGRRHQARPAAARHRLRVAASGQQKVKVVAVAEPSIRRRAERGGLGLIDANGKLVAQAPFEAAISSLGSR